MKWFFFLVTLYFPAIVPSYQKCTKDSNYNLSGLFVLFLCTMKSDWVNDASLKGKCCCWKAFCHLTKDDFSNIGHQHDKFSLMTRWQQIPHVKVLTKTLSCVLTWPRPSLTLKKSQPSQVSALFPDLVRSGTRKDAHQQTRLQTVLTQCSHSGAAWLLFFFSWLWWMRRAVYRSGTNAGNTFPARRGRLNQRDCPRLSWLTESFGPRFWQEQTLREENTLEMCILRRLLQYLFATVYK